MLYVYKQTNNSANKQNQLYTTFFAPQSSGRHAACSERIEGEWEDFVYDLMALQLFSSSYSFRFPCTQHTQCDIYTVSHPSFKCPHLKFIYLPDIIVIMLLKAKVWTHCDDDTYPSDSATSQLNPKPPRPYIHTVAGYVCSMLECLRYYSSRCVGWCMSGRWVMLSLRKKVE